MQQWNEEPPPPATAAGFCDGCGARIAGAERFCTACGRPQHEFCSWCGAELANTSLFCVSCGRPAVRERARIYPRGAVAGKPIASFAFRAGVMVADWLIVSIPTEIGLRVTEPATHLRTRLDEYQTYLDQYGVTAEAWAIIAPLVWVYGLFLLLGLASQVTWNSIGWSPAQRIIGLRIVDAEGRPPGWRRGLKRTAAAWLSALALSLGYFAAGWHPEKRTWHDRIAGTWVVDVREQR